MLIKITYKLPGQELRYSWDMENDDYSLKIEEQGERTTVHILPKRTIVIKRAELLIPHDYSDTAAYFVNGYQSWTDAREHDIDEDLHNMKLVPKPIRKMFSFEAYGDSLFRPYRKGEPHGFTFAYLRDDFDSCDLIGSLNEENAFLVITYQKEKGCIRLESDCEGRRLSDEFKLFDFIRTEGKRYEVLEKYFSHFGTCKAKPIRGYTSWYLDYQDISEEKMRNTLRSVDGENFDLFQIDDGYETYVGDWMDIDPMKFPTGLAGLVEEIHARGLLAGIWLAPFVCEEESRIFAEHPDWVYTNKKTGEPVSAGYNWSGFSPLDIRRADVRNYIRSCLEYYMNLGFDFFKLDFLYAAAMIKSSRFTRAEMMRFGMKFLREVLSDKLILGCGVPLSSAFNLVDYCRIGPDVSLEFDDKAYMRPMHRERISTRITLQNTIFRQCMDGSVFLCDPDVFLLRDDNIKLSKEQKEALVTINHLCGSVYMTSDDPGTYDDEKKAVLRDAQKLSDAVIWDVKKDGKQITVLYSQDGEAGKLVYDTKAGVLR